MNEHGLTLSEEKTKITHLSEDFRFLEDNFNNYNSINSVKVLTILSKDIVKSFMDKANYLYYCAISDLESSI